jgi:hypothetical protein
MSPRDWTDPSVYAHMRSYEVAELAAEYLLRNDAFIEECRVLASEHEARAGELIGSPDFVARWGLRFHQGG